MARFDDGKAPDAMRTIGEVSAAFGIKPHVLRYWEQQFPMLQPLKRSGGRRLYRAADITLVETIDRLVNQQGYTLKGANKALREGVTDAEAPAKEAMPNSHDATTNRPEVVDRLKTIRDGLASAMDD
ncbi:MerR family transcriptional regulator [Aurantiacibacter rhizosphaerae]|uniref:MerR family transcriptional regulator n=1 Tax=Aurantiacibacter rhizosphaerae TaxID=2691582 RepID=A0A844XFM2_9SPHN|nr:MerR family transcriptional regulator [Aurantiacibacter rhizosphaerae]MWV29421.1 MerR family transcriptional regulator [Aurantiacibacter rhizosphaerae]